MDPAEVLAATAAGALENLESVDVRWVSMPLRRAHVAAHGRQAARELLVVAVTDGEGVVGWGECPTLAATGYTDEHTAGAWQHLRDVLVPRLLAGELDGALGDGEVLDPAFPMASAGVEGALVDLGLRRTQQGLAGVLGATVDRLRRCVVVSLPDGGGDGELLAEVSAAVSSGAAMVKLKVDPRVGVGHVAVVRREFPDLPLAMDANGSLAGASTILDALGALGIAYVEQPLPPGHPDAVGVARRLGVPVALDESAVGPQAIADALAAGEGSLVNLKPARVGGLAPAVRCWHQAVALGAPVFVGGMLETAVGRSAAATLAAAVASTHDDALPTDLGPSAQYFASDIGGPIVTDNEGRLVVPAGPGAADAPDDATLDAVTVDRWQVRCR